MTRALRCVASHVPAGWQKRRSRHVFVTSLAAVVLLGTPEGLAQPARLGPGAGGRDEPIPAWRAAPARATPAPPGWLEWLNAWRDAAHLPPVAEDLVASADARLHAQYCVRNGVLVHDEDDANPWRTAEGDRAGNASNVAVHAWRWTDERDPIDTWIRGPFHALGLLDPALATVGYGMFASPGPGQRVGAAATLDVLRGRVSGAAVSRVVAFPGDGAVVPFPQGCHGGACYPGAESPNPLTACPGYTAPTGLPLILQLGERQPAPQVSASALVDDDGRSLAHCVFTAGSYDHPEPAQQALGRRVLASRGAIVLIPRRPLPSGTSYSVSVVAGRQRHTWSFSVVDGALPASTGGASSADAR